MAKQTIIKLIDDTDGKPADETVAFAYEGMEYTIDLSEKNAAKLRKILKLYAENGVKVKAQRRSPGTEETTPAGRARIRAWAKQHMFGQFPNLGDRGRIPAEVVAAYRRAHGLR